MNTKVEIMNQLNRNKWITWAVLLAFAAPYAQTFAGAPDEREMIRQDIEKKFEAETPNIGPNLIDKVLKQTSENVKKNAIAVLTDFKDGVRKGYKLAKDGNGTIVVVGAKDGWKFFKHFGKAAGIHYRDSVWLLPDKAKAIGQKFAKEGGDVADLATHEARQTADVWKWAGGNIADDAKEAIEGYKSVTSWAGDCYKSEAEHLASGVKDGAINAVEWSKDVAEWTGSATKDAFRDLTKGTVENVKNSADLTYHVGKFFAEETGDALRSASRWSENTWDFTVDSTKGAWACTKSAGKGVFQGSTELAGNIADWLNQNTLKPLTEQAKDGIEDVSRWNWKRGWDQGVKEGFKTAGEAYRNQDTLLGTLWAVYGIGKGVVHVLLLEPLVVPFIAAYGVAGTTVLGTLGYPSVGAIYGLGTAASGLTYLGGSAVTAALATTGTLLTIGAGGAGIIRTAGTAAVGTGVTAAVGAGAATYTTVAAGINGIRTVATPIVGGIGMAGAVAGGTIEMVGATVWNGGKMVAVTGLTGAGYGLVTGFEAAKIASNAILASGVTVFDNAIVTPIGTVFHMGQALASGVWTLAEDPVLGTLNLVGAGGVALGTIVTSTGAFTYEFVKGTLKALVADGVPLVFNSGIWAMAAVAKGVDFTVSAFNIPKHHEWAAFRKAEIDDSYAAIKEQAGAELSKRFGEIILIRTFWWGKDKGRTRFFITKNKESGERWYFKRSVDSSTGEILYSVTNKDPAVRAFQKTPWAGTFHSGYYYK
jgi:hypothetical protein